MIYTRLEYAIFLILLLLLYYLWRNRSYRLHLLAMASLFFYGWSGLFDLAVFITVIGVTYLTVLFSHWYPRWRQTFVTAGISLMILHLFLWKYLPWAGRGFGAELELPLPLGISFFTFQGVAYIVDFNRGQAELMGFRQFVLFKSFFPQLIAGPIVRARDMWGYLKTLGNAERRDVIEGLALIGIGLIKKLVIADYLGIFAETIFSDPGRLDRPTLMLGAAAFYVQIWGDFAGYTDIGRGSALLFGLRLPENFYSTLYADGGLDWGRRWHATLQAWILNYFYFPLVALANRLRIPSVSTKRWNAMMSILCKYPGGLLLGLWHGASFNFILWGAALCLIATVEAMLEWLRIIPRDRSSFKSRALGVIIMFPVLMVTAVIFRCSNLADLKDYLSHLLGPNHSEISFVPYASGVYWRLGLAYLIDGILYYNMQTRSYSVLNFLKLKLTPLWQRWPGVCMGIAGVAAAAMIVLALAFRANDNPTGFIYFRF